MNYNADANPLRMPIVIFLVALSVSIGWGIRGNFGHEAGAMIPGALGAIAIACTSRRWDWQARIPHAALWGGLGWGFGGSISYMYPISFTMSGHFPTMYYGFLTTFLEGGLWCAMGTMGAALALTSDREKLAPMYKPLIWVLVAMWIHNLIHDRIDHWLQPPSRVVEDATWNRQENPLYWFDADWASAVAALIGVCLYDQWNSAWKAKSWRRFSLFFLVVVTVVGGFAGYNIQKALDNAGYTPRIVDALVVPQGDLSYVNPATGEHFDPANLMNNWPQFFGDHPEKVGILIGVAIAFLGYCLIVGQWRNGSGLFLYMSLGWLLAFLAMPVFGSLFMMDYGGFRAMPPRSDDWAGVVGVFIGACLWTWRNDQKATSFAGVMSFLLGGLGFTTAQLFRCIAMIPGNPYRTGEEYGPFLKHYQSANWHSVLEQSQGFCLGLAMVITLGAVWRVHAPRNSDQTMPKGTSVFAAWFVMFVITFFNVFKNVERWTEGDAPLVPNTLTAPLISFIQFSASTWFNFVWWTAALAGLAVFMTHTRRRLPLLSGPPAGRGQLMFLCILWLIVTMNFARALPFSEGRVITEWVVTMNACIVTALVMIVRTDPFHPPTLSPARLPRLRWIWVRGLSGAVALMFVYAVLLKALYGGGSVTNLDHAHRRFGPDAIWRTKPILKNEQHR